MRSSIFFEENRQKQVLFEEKPVPLQSNKRAYISNGIKNSDSRMYCIRFQGDA